MTQYALPLALLAAFTLAGCSMTVPVEGLVQNSDESFAGTATGYMGGSGVMSIRSNRGAECEGSFVYVTARQGEGVFRCSDGRSGPFTFASTGSRGTGSGTLGYQQFTFTFGG